jgi:hypothetical protein
MATVSEFLDLASVHHLSGDDLVARLDAGDTPAVLDVRRPPVFARGAVRAARVWNCTAPPLFIEYGQAIPKLPMGMLREVLSQFTLEQMEMSAPDRAALVALSRDQPILLIDTASHRVERSDALPIAHALHHSGFTRISFLIGTAFCFLVVWFAPCNSFRFFRHWFCCQVA